MKEKEIQIDRLIDLSRIALGIIFIWYGALKLFPHLSPAQELAVLTIDKLFFSMIPPDLSIKLLAIWELFIGVCFITKKFVRASTVLFLTHMLLTFTPLFLLPELCFTQPPFIFTLTGQYIVKNLVFILAGLMIYKKEKTSCV